MSINFDITSPLTDDHDNIGNGTDVNAVISRTPTIKTFDDVDVDVGHSVVLPGDVNTDDHDSCGNVVDDHGGNRDVKA